MKIKTEEEFSPECRCEFSTLECNSFPNFHMTPNMGIDTGTAACCPCDAGDKIQATCPGMPPIRDVRDTLCEDILTVECSSRF